MQRAELWGDPYALYRSRVVEAQSAALNFRRQQLKEQLFHIQRQQRVDARRELQKQLRDQVEQLEQKVQRYEEVASLGKSASRFNEDSALPGQTFPSLRREPTEGIPRDFPVPASSEQNTSMTTAIEQLVRQGEELKALLVSQKESGTGHILKDSTPVKLPGVLQDSSDSVISSRTRIKDPSASSLTKHEPPAAEANTFSSREPAPQAEAKKHLEQRESSFQVTASPSWNAMGYLPEVSWTEEDELALEKFEKGAIEDDEFIPKSITNEAYEVRHHYEGKEKATDKAQKAHDRQENRRKLEALLSASANNGVLRRPRWRLEIEAEDGIVSPYNSQDSEAMRPLQIFRSVVLAVAYVLHLQKLLLAKKMEEKESATQDFETVMNVYLDATRMWLGRVVRTPLLSLLQDPSLDVDISTKSGLAGSALRGFANKFSGLLARRHPSSALSAETDSPQVDPAKLLKLKVRMKGILDALAKAIEKNQVPAGILDFWKRLSTDGVYFPESYHLTSEERQVLEFDSLGATRRMQFDGVVLVEKDGRIRRQESLGHDRDGDASGCSKPMTFPRFDVVMINFLCVRVLIPYVILQPWEAGIGSKNVTKQVAANLQSLATLFYLVCRQLSPLPPPTEAPARRRSLTASFLASAASVLPTGTTEPSNQNPVEAEHETGQQPQQSEESNAFLSISDVGRRLVVDKDYPSHDPQVNQLVLEYQSKLSQLLRSLRNQLHSPEDCTSRASSPARVNTRPSSSTADAILGIPGHERLSPLSTAANECTHL